MVVLILFGWSGESHVEVLTVGACLAHFVMLPCVGIATANPVVDGSLDSIYGGPSVLQNTQTNFGDNTDGDIGSQQLRVGYG